MAFDMGYLYSVGVDVRCTSVMTPVKFRGLRLSESSSLVWREHGRPAARLWHIRIYCLANTVLLQQGTRQGSLKHMPFSGNRLAVILSLRVPLILCPIHDCLMSSSAFFVICFYASISHCFYHSTQSSHIPIATYSLSEGECTARP